MLLQNWKLKLAIVFAECRCLEGISSIPRGCLSQTARSYLRAAPWNDSHTHKHTCARTHSNNTLTRPLLTLYCYVLRIYLWFESSVVALFCWIRNSLGLHVLLGTYSCLACLQGPLLNLMLLSYHSSVMFIFFAGSLLRFFFLLSFIYFFYRIFLASSEYSSTKVGQPHSLLYPLSYFR